MNSCMLVELKDLQLFGRHGWHADEALTGNEFIVNITLAFAPPENVITSIEDTINYAAVYQLAKTEFAQPQQLLETCAMRMAESIYKHFPQLTCIEISIYKMAAPIANFKGRVGITYKRSFK